MPFFLFIEILTTYLNIQGEVEHKRVKKFYPRTQKRKYTQGIAKQQRRERLLHLISQIDPYSSKPVGHSESKLAQVSKDLPPVSPYEHHQMSTATEQKINIIQWLDDNQDDPALKVTIISFCSSLHSLTIFHAEISS